MSSLLKSIQCSPNYPMYIAAGSYTVLTITSALCLFLYYTEIANNEFTHYPLIAYILMLANGLTGFTEFLDEDSFCPLRDLLDYCQLVLTLPCYTAEMWLKTEMGPNEVALIHAGLGFVAAVMYVVMEYRRQDLTDLAVFANTISLIGVGVLGKNYLAVAAGVIFAAGYYVFKRSEDQCCLAPQDKFNFVMALFAMVSLVSFDTNILESLKSTLQKLVSSEE